MSHALILEIQRLVNILKRLHKSYAKEGIVIPYPIRAINYEQEKAE